MPGRDGTGPQGSGAMTGRGLGVCNGADATMYGAGRGCRTGRGFNKRSFRNSSGYSMQGNGVEVPLKETLESQKSELLKRVEMIEKQQNDNSEEKK